MYFTPGRRRGTRSAGAGAPQAPAGAHAGTAADYLCRHRRDATEALRQGGLPDLSRQLLDRIADSRTLLAAWDDLASDGGRAPGPDGLTYDDLWRAEAASSRVARPRAIMPASTSVTCSRVSCRCSVPTWVRKPNSATPLHTFSQDT